MLTVLSTPVPPLTTMADVIPVMSPVLVGASDAMLTVLKSPLPVSIARTFVAMPAAVVAGKPGGGGGTGAGFNRSNSFKPLAPPSIVIVLIQVGWPTTLLNSNVPEIV